MDKTVYERLFSTRAYLVISKAEELCQTCKYEAITPMVMFVSMIILEKDYLEKILSVSGLNYGSVCKKVETKLFSIPKQVRNDYCFSDSANEIISKAILNKKDNVVTIMDLLQELSIFVDINELLDHNSLKPYSLTIIPDQDLEWDGEKGVFKNVHLSYYDYKNRPPAIACGGFC